MASYNAQSKRQLWGGIVGPNDRMIKWNTALQLQADSEGVLMLMLKKELAIVYPR